MGNDGALYYVERGTGSIRKITYAGSGQSPAISQQPANATVSAGGSATFTVSAFWDRRPLAYQWQRNQADIPGANAASYTLSGAQAADSGARFRCQAFLGSATSQEATLTVILQPASHKRTSSRQRQAPPIRPVRTLAFAGMATDPQQGNLPRSRPIPGKSGFGITMGNSHSHPAYGTRIRNGFRQLPHSRSRGNLAERLVPGLPDGGQSGKA